MCRACPGGEAVAMNTDTMNPQAPESEHASRTERSPLRRPFAGRMLAGVAEGVGRYLDVDTTIVRIAFVVLVFFGGAGIALYLAGLLLIPDEGSDQSIAGSIIHSLQSR
jgi:phage shock protein PspC (stress-responsive transcriptional regulator)